MDPPLLASWVQLGSCTMNTKASTTGGCCGETSACCAPKEIVVAQAPEVKSCCSSQASSCCATKAHAPVLTESEAVRVSIGGMTCSGCCTRIEGFLRQQRGIVSAEVSLLTSRGVIEFDPSVTTVPGIEHMITMLGFTAVAQGDASMASIVLHVGDASPELVKQQLRQVDGVVATHDHTKDDPSDKPGNSVLVEYDPSCVGARTLVQRVSDAIEGAPVTVSAPRPHVVVSEELEVARYRRFLITSVLLSIPVLFLDYIVPLLGANVQSACSSEIFRGFSWDNLVGVICATPILFYIAMPIHESAFLALRYGSRVTMDVLISLSSFSAYIFSVVTVVLRATGVLPALAEGAKDETFFEVTVMLVTLIVLGRYIETIVKAKAAHSVDALLKIQAKSAILIEKPPGCGSKNKAPKETNINVLLVERGDLLRVLPGTRVPTDGVVVEGESSIDESMITGEARKVTKKVGSAVIGGTINAQGVLVMRVTHTINESMLARIVSLVDEAQASKSVSQSVADIVSSYFTVFIIVVAVTMFVVWYELARLGKIDTQGWSPFPFALRFALTILVISCPCAISLAVPTAIMVGTTMGSKSGVLFKGGRALEALDKVDIVLFDKTGTLTTGQVQVVSIYAAASFSGAVTGEAKTQALLKLWTNLEAAERNSEHPIGRAIVRRANTMKIEHLDVTDFEALPGHGVRCQVDGRPVCVGSVKWIRDDLHLTIPVDLVKRNDAYQAEGRIVVCLAVDGVVLGLVALQDATRAEAKAVVQQLCERNIGTWIVTGDQQKTALTLANELYITDDAVVANALPEDKVEKVRELQAMGKRVAFVGDGVNDAPALAAADVGVAIGAGTDVAIESADLVLVKDDLFDLLNALDLSKATNRIIHWNFTWGFTYNVLMMPLACGALYPLFKIAIPPAFAGLSELLSSVPVILFALLLNFWKPPFNSKTDDEKGAFVAIEVEKKTAATEKTPLLKN